jgi:hypothetical protein
MKEDIVGLRSYEKYDKTTYAIQRTDTLKKVGCSGSPVFYRKNVLDSWKFGGVFVRSSNEIPISLIVKPELVLKLLNFTQLNQKRF